jgi:hypothetical protein
MTINLDDNKIPFGLLSEEEQEHLMTWPHGLECWVSYTDTWYRTSLKGFSLSTIDASNIYRTIPAPVEPERETVWVYLNDKRKPYSLTNPSYAKTILSAVVGFAFRVDFDAETGDNPTIVKESFDD